jgi:hypothetical protein
MPDHATPGRAADPSLTHLIWALAIGWFIASGALGSSGLLAAHASLIALFVPVPVAAFAVALRISRRLRNWVMGFDPQTLVSVQALRMAGISFLAVYAVGKLNAAFALWAGLLDFAVALSAPFVAARMTPILATRQRRLVACWLVLGLVDLLVAIPLARICRAENPASMTALSYPPLSLITTYFVPLALIDYIMLSARIGWLSRRGPFPATALPR